MADDCTILMAYQRLKLMILCLYFRLCRLS
nr:MAG TPA: hypothetical protein [Caudoviricetes sp.]